jgi:hypothetical protein
MASVPRLSHSMPPDPQARGSVPILIVAVISAVAPFMVAVAISISGSRDIVAIISGIAVIAGIVGWPVVVSLGLRQRAANDGSGNQTADQRSLPAVVSLGRRGADEQRCAHRTHGEPGGDSFLEK